MWADVHASSPVLTLTAIALFGTYKRRHGITPFLFTVSKKFFSSGEAAQRATASGNPLANNKLRSKFAKILTHYLPVEGVP
jgi:hypothetical protein